MDNRWLVRFYNPIAAMPSHHVAFAVVTGLGMARFARNPLVRTFGVVYPAAVSLVVVATGNHYTADVIAGAALGAAARVATR
ncbi:MAG: phosphatase PAP2 family protein [Acidimicrobiaceae bacterium]|nr:phosphatase PAP2 family protein [Acidimicrobiaceae bacterium]